MADPNDGWPPLPKPLPPPPAPAPRVLSPAGPRQVRVYAFTDLDVEIVWIDRQGRIQSIVCMGANGDCWVPLDAPQGR